MRNIVLTYATTPAAGQVGSGTQVPLNMNNTSVGVGIVCIVTGTVNYSVEHTYDNVLDPALVSGATWLPHGVANMTGATTTQESNFVIPIAALRVTINSGGGSVKLIVTEQGIV